jgi:thymidine kinase
MFSGKTEEFIRRIKRAQYMGYTVGVFKPQLDDRYSTDSVVSHNSTAIQAINITSSKDLLNYDFDVIALDEVQFIDSGIIQVANTLAVTKRVILCGLDMDFKGDPFGPMPHLLCCAEYVTKLHAMTKNGIANFSVRTTSDTSQILLGEKDSYIPMTRKEFYDYK